MSNLDQVRAFIATGDKDNALAVLASMLMRNKDQMEAWLLLGDLIDDPSRKKDCYNQVLRLSPRNFHALTKLQELQENQADAHPLTNSNSSELDDQRPTKKVRKPSIYVPNQNFYPPAKQTTGGGEIIGYVIVGLAGFLVITYVIANPNTSSSASDSLYIGLILLSLIAAIIVVAVSSKNRR